MLIVVLTGGVYKVIVKTGAKKNGGTDAKVIINTINMKKKKMPGGGTRRSFLKPFKISAQNFHHHFT